MNKKTSIIIGIGTFTTIMLSIIGYFVIQHFIEKDFYEKTFQCSNDTEKRRESLRNNDIIIEENFYSQKLKTCIIIGVTGRENNNVLNTAERFIKELYTGKTLESFAVCNTIEACGLVRDYNTERINELKGLEEEKLENICSSEDQNNPLVKYCSLVESWNSKKEWRKAVENYR